MLNIYVYRNELYVYIEYMNIRQALQYILERTDINAADLSEDCSRLRYLGHSMPSDATD